MLNGRRRAWIIVSGSLFGFALGFLTFLIFYGLPRWEDALASTLYLSPIPVLILLFYTRPGRK